MTMENIPWAVGGGIVSPSVARMLAYQATGGAEGIAGIGDFAVRQLSVAGSSVRISPGGGILVSRYPGARNESYMCRAGDETPLAIPQNAGTTTRYDLVIARVDDWNMPGGQATPTELPTDAVAAAKFQVITNVPASTRTAKQLNLNYPAIALARIAMPAATSAVTQAMITDLREMAVPRRKRDLRALNQAPGRDNSLTYGGAEGERFPDDGIWTVEIPEWATRVKVIGQWGSLFVPAAGVYARLWLKLDAAAQGGGILYSQDTLVDFTTPPNDPSRVFAFVADDLAIPAAMRGTSAVVTMYGRHVDGAGRLKADAATSISFDLEFVEAPTEDM